MLDEFRKGPSVLVLLSQHSKYHFCSSPLTPMGPYTTSHSFLSPFLSLFLYMFVIIPFPICICIVLHGSGMDGAPHAAVQIVTEPT